MRKRLVLSCVGQLALEDAASFGSPGKERENAKR
jgi:hypothetical protein